MMDLVKEYKRNTLFKNENEIFESLKDVFTFGIIKSEYKTDAIIQNKEEINDTLVQFLESLLSKNLVNNKNDKITLINLIDEFNFRNEILDLIRKKNHKNLKKTSERLGKKFMSLEN